MSKATDGHQLDLAQTIDVRPAGDYPETGARMLARIDSSTAQSLIERMALDKACDRDKLKAICDFAERLTKMENEREIMEDKRRWCAAVAAVQADAPNAVKDQTNTQTDSRFAKTEQLVSRLKPVWTDAGLWVTFDQRDSTAEGMERHVAEVGLGLYSKEYHVDLPPDNTGPQGTANKTIVQGLKSTAKYAQGILLSRIFAITFADGDNDGNGAEAGISALDAEQIAALLEEATGEHGEEGADVVAAFWRSMKAKDLSSIAELDAKTGSKSLIWLRDKVAPLRKGAEIE